MDKNDERYTILRIETESLELGLSDFGKEKQEIETICDRAKAALLSAFMYDYGVAVQNCGVVGEGYSPIEQIFFIAYSVLGAKRNRKIKWTRKADGKMRSEYMYFELLNFSAQKEEAIDGKKYFIDFVIDFRPVADNSDIRYAIELDGYDYHSSKEQMNRDYERERALQKAGYKVIRFTGSQIYKTPFSCAREVIEIILDDASEYIEFDD